jgi:hypothetical protein
MYLPKVTTFHKADLTSSLQFISFLVCVSSEVHVGIKNVIKLSKPMTEDQPLEPWWVPL